MLSLNKYERLKSENKHESIHNLNIGILGLIENNYSSRREKKIFDLYINEYQNKVICFGDEFFLDDDGDVNEEGSEEESYS